jgi:dTDP-4-dehydrorhamnose 3,5-epimerase
MTIENKIFGVEIKQLKSHGDQRGFFREILRASDPAFQSGVFGQWSHSKMAKAVVKAWHYHHIQTDWWYIPFGQVETVLFDNRPESPTFKSKMVFLMGDSMVHGPETNEVLVRIPPGVLHGLKVLSDGGAHIMYITSITYDPNEEGRFPFNSPLVGHDWGENVIVVDNDKREFVPHSTRISIR